MGGSATVRESGTDMCVRLCLKRKTARTCPTVQGLGSVSCGSLDPRGVRGSVDTRVRMAELLPCPPETITVLFIG